MTQSRTGRLIFLAALLLFVLVCGIHIAGVHHDDDGHAIAVGITILVGFAVATVLSKVFVTEMIPVLAAMSALPSLLGTAGPRGSLPAGWRLPLLR